jgi:hypothetical protein
MEIAKLNRGIELLNIIVDLKKKINVENLKRTKITEGSIYTTIYSQVKGKYKNPENNNIDDYTATVDLKKEDLLRAVNRSIFELEQKLFVAQKKLEEL